MKLWISLSVLAMLALFLLYMQDENHTLSHSPGVPTVAANQSIFVPNPPAMKKSVRPSRPHATEIDSQIESQPADEAAETPPQQPAVDQNIDLRPDLMTWKNPQPSTTEYTNFRSEKVEDRTECPLVMVTYGDEPVANVRVEQRKSDGQNFDSVGCPTNYLVSRDR